MLATTSLPKKVCYSLRSWFTKMGITLDSLCKVRMPQKNAEKLPDAIPHQMAI